MLQSKNIFITALLLLVVSSSTIRAQTTTSIKGRVIDNFTKTHIPHVNVEVMGTTIGDEADSTGNYELKNLIAGTYYIKASRIGYKEKIKKVVLHSGESKIFDIYLSSKTLRLKSVEVKAERLWEKYLTEASLVNVQRMRARDIISIPGAIDDPMRAVQVFSGVAGVGDYSGYMAVRGSSPDQNQVIMDGIIIPSPYRFRLAFGGGLSSINPNTIRDMYLHLGGFSAEYGNSLSSILEVESRTGNLKRIRVQGNLNFTDVNSVIDGPLGVANGSFLFSVRRTYFDVIANSISNSNSAFPFYFELSNRFKFDIDKNNRIFINFVRNREGAELLDELSEGVSITEDATTYLVSLSWRRLHNEKWQFNTALSYYRDSLDYLAFTSDTLGGGRNNESLDSKVVNFSFKGDIRYKTADESWFKWGVSAIKIPSKINFESANLSFFYARVESPQEIDFDKTYHYYATYLESSTKATDKLHLRIGARYDYSTLIDDGELSPRFSIWYKLNDRTTLEGSWGLFYQFPNPIPVYSRNVPVDISANLDIISPEKATHQILSVERTFVDDFSAKLQFYSKDFDRLLLPVDEQTFAPTNSGIGFSRGFEFILEKKSSIDSRFSGVMSYSFGNAKYRSIESEQWLPFKYDRRHALSILSNIKIVGNWNLSILAQYSSGFPFTEVLGLRNNLDFNGNTSFDFVRAGRYEARLPAFKKIDARLSYQRHLGNKGFSFYLEVINLTNQRNVQEITWEKKYLPDNRQKATKRIIYMLPIIPSFGVSFRI